MAAGHCSRSGGRPRPPACGEEKRNWNAVAKQTLDALDRGELYMLPQIDGRMAWRFKRLMPRLYTRIAGETYRLLAD